MNEEKHSTYNAIYQTRRIYQGFTLIELLVVVSIIVIIASISLFGVQNSRSAARDAKRRADVESMRQALEIYRADNGGYPDRVSESGGEWEVSNDSPTPDWLENLDDEYLENRSLDPLNDSNYYYRYARCSGGANPDGTINNYKIQVRLESESTPDSCTECTGNQGGTGGWLCITNFD